MSILRMCLLDILKSFIYFKIHLKYNVYTFYIQDTFNPKQKETHIYVFPFDTMFPEGLEIQ